MNVVAGILAAYLDVDMLIAVGLGLALGSLILSFVLGYVALRGDGSGDDTADEEDEDDVGDEFTELQDFFNDPQEAARLLADVREWRQANPGWESWDLDVRLTRFSLWMAEKHASTPEAQLRLVEDRARAARSAAGGLSR